MTDSSKIKKGKSMNDWFFDVRKRSSLSLVWLFLSILTIIFWKYIPFVLYISLVMISLIVIGLFFKNRKDDAELQWKKSFNIESLIANVAFILTFWQMMFIIFMLIKNPEIISSF
jgi:asparagine N-glycosylation enzyme membrane subunit Stt3